jgi:hypothetical protein
MKKKKAKGKTAAKKTAKKSEPELETKELNPVQVLKNISVLVEAQADKLAEAVIGEGMKGQGGTQRKSTLASLGRRTKASAPTQTLAWFIP